MDRIVIAAIGVGPGGGFIGQPLQVWLPEFEGGRVGFNVMGGLDPGYPQRGPYEASEEIYPDRGQGKTGVAKD